MTQDAQEGRESCVTNVDDDLPRFRLDQIYQLKDDTGNVQTVTHMPTPAAYWADPK
jgi:hypothetical protein